MGGRIRESQRGQRPKTSFLFHCSLDNLLRDYMLLKKRSGSLPSVSTSLIISLSSASVGFSPRDSITVPNSSVSIFPSPFLSKRENACLIAVKDVEE